MSNKKIKKGKKLFVPATKQQLKTWSDIFKVLGDEIRLQILKEIVDKPGISGKEILVNLKLAQPTLSFHLKQLHNAGIIQYHKDGQTHCYYTNNNTIEVYYERIQAACEHLRKNLHLVKTHK